MEYSTYENHEVEISGGDIITFLLTELLKARIKNKEYGSGVLLKVSLSIRINGV